jgi:hypothetical protein
MTRIALAILMLSPSYAQAGMKNIPPWHMVNGQACYEFAQAKTLLILDEQLSLLIEKDEKYGKLVKVLELEVGQLHVALSAEQNIAATLQQSNDNLSASLLAETKRADKAERRAGAFPAWAIGGGVGIVVGVVGGILLGVYATKK